VNNEGKKVLFIVNKHAGTGYQAEVEGRMTDTCARYNVECTIEFTRAPGHAIELAEQASFNGFDFVVAVGGDGTMNEVAQGALRGNIPMGIIPRGSGNGLARHLGIPLKIPTGLDMLFNSEVLAMDTFTVNGKLSLNVSGIGFDGRIANLFGNATKRGLSGYVGITLKEYFTFREFESTLTINNKILQRKAFIIAIANSSQYGNNARIAPQASVCDQLLHVNLLKKIPGYRLDFVYNLFSGALKESSFCELLEIPALHIKTSEAIPYHIDGEPCGLSDNFDIRINPASLKVLVPSSRTSQKKV